MKTIYLAGGCFWCTEAIFQKLEGVTSVLPGYTAGTVPNPSYDAVCSGTTGHAEAIKIDYDESKLSTKIILDAFFETHDPTTLNQQGADKGTQYRSGIYYFDDEQKAASEKAIADYQAQLPEGKHVTTELLPAGAFYVAEDYHQNYFKNHANQTYCMLVIDPKVRKFEQSFSSHLKQ